MISDNRPEIVFIAIDYIKKLITKIKLYNYICMYIGNRYIFIKTSFVLNNSIYL